MTKDDKTFFTDSVTGEALVPDENNVIRVPKDHGVTVHSPGGGGGGSGRTKPEVIHVKGSGTWTKPAGIDEVTVYVGLDKVWPKPEKKVIPGSTGEGGTKDV